MAEREYTLDLSDGKKMYVVENKSAPSNTRAIVHIHGLTGSSYDYAATRMALTLSVQGYDIYRPNLYYWKESARTLAECTIRTHAADVNALLADLKKRYEKVFVTGHSYGGPTAMLCNQALVDGVSLWDPTYTPSRTTTKNAEWVRQVADGLFVGKGSFEVLYGEAFMDEAATFTKEYADALSAGWTKPIQVIHAANGILIKWYDGQSFHTHAKGPTDYRVIQGTTHCFFEEGTTEPLLDATKAWFDKF